MKRFFQVQKLFLLRLDLPGEMSTKLGAAGASERDEQDEVLPFVVRKGEETVRALRLLEAQVGRSVHHARNVARLDLQRLRETRFDPAILLRRLIEGGGEKGLIFFEVKDALHKSSDCIFNRLKIIADWRSPTDGASP